MADAQLSVVLQAQVENFRAGMAAAAAAATATDSTVSSLSTNISRNIAAVNNTGLGAFVASLNTVRAGATATDQATSVLSANISRNIAAVNNTGLGAFVASLNTAQAGTSQLSTASSVLSTNVSRNIAAVNSQNLGRFTAAVNAGTLSVRQLSSTVVTPTGGLANLTRGSNTAAFALTNLGRVAQDAPFGFVGIQNNLNPLLESFQRLRVETGSNALAFKALGSSLIGPAGIGIALSVISAAVLFYQQYQQKAARETGNSEAAMKRAKKTAEEYALSLDDITRARLVGSTNAQKEITELQTLYAITQDTTISSRQRGQAVDELQRKYPEYFKNIKDENFLNGEAKNSYDRLTTSIIATARARAAQDIITKNSTRQLENQQKINDATVVYEKNLAKLQDIEKKRAVLGASAGTRETSGFEAPLDRARAKAIEPYEEAVKTIREARKDTAILDERNLALTKEITNQVKIGADLAGKVGDIGATTKAKDVKTYADVLEELNNAVTAIQTQGSDLKEALYLSPENSKIVAAYTSAIKQLTDLGYKPQSAELAKLIELRDRLYEIPDIKATPSVISGTTFDSKGVAVTKDDKLVGGAKFDGTRGVDAFKGVTVAQKKLFAEQQKFNEDFSRLIENGLTNGITSIAEGIGSAIAEGGNIFEAAGKGLLKGFGSFLSEYGKLLVAYGAAAIVKGKLDVAAFVPGAGLIAGPAAIAAGIALQIAGAAIGSFASGRSSSGGSPKNNVTAFADGGIISGPTLGLMGEYAGASSNPEVVAPLSKLKSILKSDTDREQNINLVASLGISARQLVVLLKKEEALNKRVG